MGGVDVGPGLYHRDDLGWSAVRQRDIVVARKGDDIAFAFYRGYLEESICEA